MIRSTPSRRGTAGSQIRLLLTAVFLIHLAQMTMYPIIAPLSREVGLAEWQVGVTISVAATMFALTSPFWGRRSQSWGYKPVLVAAFAIATATAAAFTVVAQLGMSALITGTALFALFVLLRGAGFGAAFAAVPAAAQAYIADITPDAATRVRGMAGIGAAQGIAVVMGAALGGILAVFGLVVALATVPVMLAGGLILIAARLRPQSRGALIRRPLRIHPLDPRVWPFLVAGFGMFTALGFVQVITGFIVQDRLGLDARTTGLVTGAVLLFGGLGMVFAQMVIVPRSGWAPPTLLRVGTVISLLGFLALILDGGAVLLYVSIFLIELGLGIAAPGYTAGPSLLMQRDEQGGLAGLIGATNGLTFVLAPTLGTAFYSLWAPLPILVGAGLMTVVVVFVLGHPRFRRPRRA